MLVGNIIYKDINNKLIKNWVKLNFMGIGWNDFIFLDSINFIEISNLVRKISEKYSYYYRGINKCL